ncbi:MAG TPA: hypothetical protein VF290_21515 [Pyrinomonadaceae bacterium]
MAEKEYPKAERRPEKQHRRRKELEPLVQGGQLEFNGSDRVDEIGEFGDGDGLGGPDGPPFGVALSRSAVRLDHDAALWSAIKNRTEAISGERYEKFISRVFRNDISDVAACFENHKEANIESKISQPEFPDIAEAVNRKRDELVGASLGYGVDAYSLLKYATQAFLLLETGIVIQTRDDKGVGEPFVEGDSRLGITSTNLKERLSAYLGGNLNGPLPYLQRIVDALVADWDQHCQITLTHRFTCPSMLELIWSYWHEEGMLVQTMNAICMRFQNRRGPSDRDPLANLELDPLRPLNNLLWGYIQDEYNRLTVPRRCYEYDHHYGLKLVGKAVPELRSAESRSKFIEAFHNLLHRTAAFYREDADTTVIADGFPLLNALREVHLALAEGAHNQFGDLPWTARAEMLMMQHMLGRSEIREFLRGRAMVPYNERWMGQVDTMKKLQGWTDTTITHFHNLAVYGEQILLSVRYGDWNDTTRIDSDHAKVWARYWRPEIQGYIHAYLAATGVDLSEDIVDFRGAPARYVQPSTLLQNRINGQGPRPELPAAHATRRLTAGGLSFGALSRSRRRALNPARKD